MSEPIIDPAWFEERIAHSVRTGHLNAIVAEMAVVLRRPLPAKCWYEESADWAERDRQYSWLLLLAAMRFERIIEWE